MPAPDPAVSNTQRFVDQLNTLEHPPTWAHASMMDVKLVDLTREATAVAADLDDLRRADQGFDPIVDPALAKALTADINDHEQRLRDIQPGHGQFHLATGEVIQYDELSGQAHQSGWWFGPNSTQITTPHGDRFHRPSIDPSASIHPSAMIDPTARIEPGATIGARARIGAHAHIGREASIGGHSVIQDGVWIGPYSELSSNCWISEGASIGAGSCIGHQATVGAGASVESGSEIEPYSRLGAGTTTSSTSPNKPHRSVHLANAVENIMRLDRE